MKVLHLVFEFRPPPRPSHKVVRIDVHLQAQVPASDRRQGFEPSAQIALHVDFLRRFQQDAMPVPPTHDRDGCFGGAEHQYALSGRRA